MSGTDKNGWRARPKAVAIDLTLIYLFLLMAEFLVIAFSGRKGPTGLLLTPEEILDLLSYGWLLVVALVLALGWQALSRVVGASPGVAAAGLDPSEVIQPWTQTLRGWFSALLIQLTLFTGWLITETRRGSGCTRSPSRASSRRSVAGLLSPCTCCCSRRPGSR